MKTSLALILMVSLAGVAAAQVASGPDRIGIYADLAATQTVVQHEPGTPFEIYLILTNPSGAGGVIGWEASLAVPDNAAIWGYNVPGTNWLGFTQPSDLMMAYSAAENLPDSGGPILRLMTFIIWLLDDEPAQFTLGPGSCDSAGTGRPAYIHAADLGDVISLTPYPDGEDSVAFCFNPIPTAVEPSTWGEVKSLYR